MTQYHYSDRTSFLNVIWVTILITSQLWFHVISIAPPTKIQRRAPRSTFHVQVWNSVDTCNSPVPTKKSLSMKSKKTNRKSDILNFLSKICALFAISRRCTLTNSSKSFNRMNIIFGQSNINTFATLHCEDLEFSLKWVLCPWQPDKFRCFTIKQESVVTRVYNVRCAPDFTCFIRVLARRHLHANIQWQS